MLAFIRIALGIEIGIVQAAHQYYLNSTCISSWYIFWRHVGSWIPANCSHLPLLFDMTSPQRRWHKTTKEFEVSNDDIRRRKCGAEEVPCVFFYISGQSESLPPNFPTNEVYFKSVWSSARVKVTLTRSGPVYALVFVSSGASDIDILTRPRPFT